MFGIKFVAAVCFASFLFTGGIWSGCHSTNDTKGIENMSAAPDDASGEVKTLAEGSVSPITAPFVAVVRDGETYATLRNLAANLPALNEDFFRANVVIAAFLGERNTGGYSVAISREPNEQIRIAEKAPRKGMMVAQMITSPFKMVSVATNGTPSIRLSVDERFRQRTELYQITKGSFSVSGGVAGRSETYQLGGKIQVTRLSGLVTIGLAVASSGAARERELRDWATGIVRDNGIVISKLSHGSLLETPSGDLHANVRFSEKNRLNLDLDSGPATVPDGFSGRGSIEAERVAASEN